MDERKSATRKGTTPPPSVDEDSKELAKASGEDAKILGHPVSRRAAVFAGLGLAGYAMFGGVLGTLAQLVTPKEAGAVSNRIQVGNLAGLPPCTIRMPEHLMIRDAQVLELPGSLRMVDEYLQDIEDGHHTYGSEYRTIAIDWSWPRDDQVKDVLENFKLKWSGVAYDEDGDACDVYVYSKNIYFVLSSAAPGAWHFDPPYAILGTYNNHLQTYSRAGEGLHVNLYIDIYKAGTWTPAKGTYVFAVDDIDSFEGFNGNYPQNHFAERVVTLEGTSGVIYFKDQAALNNLWVTRTLEDNDTVMARRHDMSGDHNDNYDMTTGFYTTCGAHLGFASLGMNFHTQFLGNPLFPVKLIFQASVRNGSTIAPGTYIIRSAVNGKAPLDATGGYTGDGAGIVTRSDVTGYASLWQVSVRTDGKYGYKGSYVISPVSSLNEAMDWYGNMAVGTQVRQNYVNKSRGQEWRIVDVGGGLFEIRTVYDSRVLDVPGGTPNAGANVQTYTPNGTAAQRWVFERHDLKLSPETTPFMVDSWDYSLEGAKFDVFRAGDNALVGSFTTDRTGTAWIDTPQWGHNLPVGNYYFRQTAAPTGLRPETDREHFFSVTSQASHNNWLTASNEPFAARLFLTKMGMLKTGSARIPNGVYRIKSAVKGAGNTDYFLSVQNGDANPGAINPSVMQRWNGSTQQMWIVVNAGGGRVYLVPCSNVSRALYPQDATNYKAVETSPLVQAESAQWRMDARGSNWCLRFATNAGLELCSPGSSNYQDNKCLIVNADGGLNRQWVFERLDVSNKVVETGNGQPSAGDLSGAVYSVYSDSACTKREGTFTTDRSGSAEFKSDRHKINIVQAMQTLWIRETKAPANYKLDKRTYKVCAWYFALPVSQLNIPLFLVDEPSVATLTFVMVIMGTTGSYDEDVVHTATVPIGTTVRDGQGPFADADGKAKAKLGEHVFGYTMRWSTTNKRSEFDEKKYVSGTVEKDMTLYLFIWYGRVSWYCDGTSDEAWPRGNLVARTGYLPYGTWVAPDDDARRRSTLPNCTPGWVGWYTDPDAAPLHPERAAEATMASADAARAADAPFAGTYLHEPMMKLYAANLATTSFGISSGSERLPEDGASYFTRDERGHEAPVGAGELGAPGPEVARVRSTQRKAALPPVVYEKVDGYRLRTHRSVSWCADEPCATPGTTSWTVEGDSTRWGSWHESVADGVVDERG